MNGREGTNVDDGAAREAERAKKIYRYATDTARRIDEAMPACKATGDLFTTYMEGLRQKIRDNCEKLMFVDPLAYGRKALELLWRKAYYDTVSTAKKLRVRDDDDDNYIFTHIVCGIGHYHHLISRIITEMEVNITTLDYPPLIYDDDGAGNKKKVDEDVRQWGAGVVHTCLIYLGDLTRYQCEMFDGVDASIAARYYLQAAHLDLSSGMPYNQLGNLYTDRNHNLDSVCYYIHCLSCAVPFEGAEGNLLRLFEKNAQYVEAIDADRVEELPKNERIKLTVARVLMLAENWYMAKENVDIAHLCNVTAHDFKVCLSYDEPIMPKNYKEYTETKDAEIMYPSYLNPDIVYKIVQICLFCIHKVNEIDSDKAFAVKAFTLALYSQLLHKFLEQMHRCGFQNPSRKRSSQCKRNGNASEAETVEELPDDDIKEISVERVEQESSKVNGFISDDKENVNGIIKSNGKKSSLKRRRRRRVNSASSEGSDNESKSESEASVLSNEGDCSSQSDGSYCSDDTDDGQSDDETKNEKNDTITNDKLNETNIAFDANEIRNESRGLDETAIQNFLRGYNFLPCLKLLQDWVSTEKDLIMSCGESGDSLFQSVVDLLNIIQLNFISKSNHFGMPSCKILDFAKCLSAKLEYEFKVIPLPEDLNLRGTDVCKYDKDAAEWDILKKYSPTVYEENIIRILNFVRFGHHIAKIVPRIRYNRSMQVFFLKKNHVKAAAKNIHKEVKKKPQRTPPKPRHGDTSLMRSLGRLWLQSQVRELECAVRGGGRRAPPAYLVVDADALTLHTKLVKELVKARRFVVLVPTVVLQSMDELKKEVGGARDAIRWLETQLQSGSRFLRTQRPGETRPLPLVKYPRKASKQVQQFVQIIEFCHHFVAGDAAMGDRKNSERKGQALLVLLTGTKLSSTAEEQKDFSYTGVAQSAGVTVDSVVHFTTKWRHLIGKPGSKR